MINILSYVLFLKFEVDTLPLGGGMCFSPHEHRLL